MCKKCSNFAADFNMREYALAFGKAHKIKDKRTIHKDLKDPKDSKDFIKKRHGI